MKVGTILYTKDGRKIGNAIVLKEKDWWEEYAGISFVMKVNKVKTDFGNVIWLTDIEISQLFYTYSRGFSSRYSPNVLRWVLAKAKLFFKF
jgi:hypothetical protein